MSLCSPSEFQNTSRPGHVKEAEGRELKMRSLSDGNDPMPSTGGARETSASISPLEPGFVEYKYYLPGVGFLGSVHHSMRTPGGGVGVGRNLLETASR
jgi:hypothetical protein